MDEFAIRVVSRDLRDIGVREIKVINHDRKKNLWLGEISFDESENKYWTDLYFRPRKNETYKSFKKRVIEVVNAEREKVQNLLLTENPKDTYKYKNGSNIEKFWSLIYNHSFSVARERGVNILPDDVKENFYKEKSEIINRTSKHFVLSPRRLIELEIETIMIFKGVEFDRWGYANKYKEADIKNRISQGMSSLEILKEIKSNYNV